MKAGIFLVPILLAGCTAVGPNYRSPPVPVPDRFVEAADAPAASSAELASWWKAFGDPDLNAMVRQALAQNLDIAAAAARIREARALERAAGAGGLPQIAAQASATRQRISENAIPAPPGGGGG